MATASERLAAALSALPFAQLPQEWEGGSRLNIPGLSSSTSEDPWDALVSAHAPGLTGEEVRFAVAADGRTISGGGASAACNVPDTSSASSAIRMPMTFPMSNRARPIVQNRPGRAEPRDRDAC